VTAGPADGARFAVDLAGATVGRGAENPIPIPDDGLSRVHARVTHEDGIYWLTDLESTNGTFVNGARLSAPHPLRGGDTINAGRTTISATLTSGGDL